MAGLIFEYRARVAGLFELDIKLDNRLGTWRKCFGTKKMGMGFGSIT